MGIFSSLMESFNDLFAGERYSKTEKYNETRYPGGIKRKTKTSIIKDKRRDETKVESESWWSWW